MNPIAVTPVSGYDTGMTRKKPGRKPQPKSKMYDKKTLSFPPGLHRRVKAAAKASKMSVSEFVSDALEGVVGAEGKTTTKEAKGKKDPRIAWAHRVARESTREAKRVPGDKAANGLIRLVGQQASTIPEMIRQERFRNRVAPRSKGE